VETPESRFSPITRSATEAKTKRKSRPNLVDPILAPDDIGGEGPIKCRERQGGVLKFYYREAA
jgi:hypothetical protein